MSDILAAIDAAVGCQQCGGPLRDSPSDDFCSDSCQHLWQAQHADRLVDYREPWDRPWDFPGIGTDAHSTGRPGSWYVGQRGYPADLVITDEVFTWVERPRPEFRLARPVFAAMADLMGRLGALTNSASVQINNMGGLAYPPPSPDPDPMQAAIDGRRNRNTGPPTRGRPPRTIGRPNTTWR